MRCIVCAPRTRACAPSHRLRRRPDRAKSMTPPMWTPSCSAPWRRRCPRIVAAPRPSARRRRCRPTTGRGRAEAAPVAAAVAGAGPALERPARRPPGGREFWRPPGAQGGEAGASSSSLAVACEAGDPVRLPPVARGVREDSQDIAAGRMVFGGRQEVLGEDLGGEARGRGVTSLPTARAPMMEKALHAFGRECGVR